MWLTHGVSAIFEFSGIRAGIVCWRSARVAACWIYAEGGHGLLGHRANEDMALNCAAGQVVSAVVPPVPDLGGTFDVVVMNSVIEHMNTMVDALELSKQVLAMLRPGGRFVLYAPDYANWRHHFFIGDFSHSYITSWRRMEELLISAGFDRIEGCYQTATSGARALPGLAAWLPFGWLDVLFPTAGLRLYKIQLGLWRVRAGVKKNGETWQS
jgi:SAM-dependent methyltransferase